MTAPAQPAPSVRRAPFLRWPVARHEFYLAIQFALMPTLVWGIVLFGWRVLILLATALAAASAVHFLLRRFTTRGKRLLYAHTAAAVLIMIALCHPMWPAWIITLAGAAIPAAFCILGGPGRERLHVAIVWAILLQLLVIPLTPQLGISRGTANAILARDRLFMGDVRNFREASLYHWPSSVDLSGDDAAAMARPEQSAIDGLDHLSQSLELRRQQRGSTGAASLAEQTRSQVDTTLATQLPTIDALIFGAVPGRIGVVSLAGILLGGLYLGYRHILRLRSVSLFLCAYCLIFLLIAIPPGTVIHVGLRSTFHLWRTLPSEMFTLLEYALLNSDLLFAAVFILALPGTEPLTPRGRHVFLVVAAVFGATLARLNLNLPAATTALCLLMPLAPLFDSLFAKRSWLTRMY
jgi:Na+-translocating ferredoxin:NAD+ oxidoreductase RnfD subunit